MSGRTLSAFILLVPSTCFESSAVSEASKLGDRLWATDRSDVGLQDSDLEDELPVDKVPESVFEAEVQPEMLDPVETERGLRPVSTEARLPVINPYLCSAVILERGENCKLPPCWGGF